MFEGMSSIEMHVSLGLILFSIGALGVFLKRSTLVALMCLELMLNGVNLVLVSFNRFYGNVHGYNLTLFVILIAAAEAAVGLSLVVAIFRSRGITDLDDLRELQR